MKYIIPLLLLVVFTPKLSGQIKGNTDAKMTILNDSIGSKPWLHDFQIPKGIESPPAFFIGDYAFYPDKKIVGINSYWIHPLSSVGFKYYYIEPLEGADYDTFEILDLNRNLCKDKNNLYEKGIPIGIPIEGNIIKISDNRNNCWNIIKGDSIYNFYNGWSNEPIIYKFDSIMSDIAFQRNDSLFILNLGLYLYFPKEFDVHSLKYIDGIIYQDNKNLYHLYDGKVVTIEDEQIVDRKIFIADGAEQPNYEESTNYIWVGKRNFYKWRSKLFNQQLQSYHFFDDSYYYFYNNNLYYFYSQDMNPYPIKGSGMRSGLKFPELIDSDEDYLRGEWQKAKTLGKDMLINGAKELFYKGKAIAYPACMDISELEYIGRFPYRLNIDFIPSDKHSYCETNSLILRYKNKNYMICQDSLVQLRKIRDKNNDGDYNNFDLNNLHFYNEYYFTDGRKLYCNDDIRGQIRYDSKGRYSKKTPYFSSKNIDLKNIKVFGRYFTDGKSLFYNYKPVSRNLILLKDIDYQYPYIIKNRQRKQDNLNVDLSFIDFQKLKLIEGTEYLTDGYYLVYKNNFAGTIDYNTLKVYNSSFLEDATQYFNYGYSIDKDVLRIKIWNKAVPDLPLSSQEIAG